MAHFAKVLSGIVQNVIVAEQEFIDNMIDTSPGEWIQTSYNTHGGVHADGGTPLRKNFATKGSIYDLSEDAFYCPQPYPSWTLNSTTFLWECPVAHPDDDGNRYTWNEADQTWDAV